MLNYTTTHEGIYKRFTVSVIYLYALSFLNRYLTCQLPPKFWYRPRPITRNSLFQQLAITVTSDVRDN